MQKFHILVVLQDREHGFEIWHKNEFAQGSHKVCIPVKFALRFWEGTESMHFFKIGTKANLHKGCVVQKFRTTGSVVRKLLSLGFSPLFSLVFTLTSFFKLSYLHVNTKIQFKPH